MKIKPIISLARKHIHYIALAAVVITVIVANKHNQFWKIEGRIIAHDVILYYQYLPATVIYDDVTMKFLSGDTTEHFKRKIWGEKLENGNYIGKMTMGLAIMYSPFFFVAHGLSGPLDYEASGFSPPYKIALIVSSVFYLFFGLYFLLRVLSEKFSKYVVALTLLAMGLGTNLYFYTTLEPTMSHAYSFFLFALFIWVLEQWIRSHKWKYAVLIAVTLGMITLVRPSNIIIAILIPLWGVSSLKEFRERFLFIFKSWQQRAVMILVFLVVISPQIAYWKYVSGDYLFYGYGEEGFFFGDPEFIKGIFSYRKGWLVYTPIMVFAIAGMVLLWKNRRELFFPVLMYVLLHMYIAFSWWCWWYGGGFGQRVMVETYALLAIPFAAFTEWIFRRHYAIIVVYLLTAGFLSFLNMFQTRQYYYGSIHWDAMSKEAYWDSFLRKKPSADFQKLIDPPDYKKALEGER